MSSVRKCSRPMCPNLAISTLTYMYAEGTVVLGPLATLPEPHCYDLCSMHSAKMVAPKGWELVRIGNTTAAAVGQNLIPNSLPSAKPVNRPAHLRVVPKP